jgi:hypothetical protein
MEKMEKMEKLSVESVTNLTRSVVMWTACSSSVLGPAACSRIILERFFSNIFCDICELTKYQILEYPMFTSFFIQ